MVGSDLLPSFANAPGPFAVHLSSYLSREEFSATMSDFMARILVLLKALYYMGHKKDTFLLSQFMTLLLWLICYLKWR